MKSNEKPIWPAARLLVISLSLSACVPVDVVERPAAEPSQAERSICRELARDFPTWAFDGEPETVANRVDTEFSVEEGLRFTAVFKAVCPGVLP